MNEGLLHKELSYKIIGLCMEVHTILGKGHSEVVYKDALEYEFQRAGIEFSREKQYKITYKDFTLPHSYCADFIVNNSVIIEAKAISCLTDSHVKQTINYLAASHLKLGLLINFGEDSLSYRRIVL